MKKYIKGILLFLVLFGLDQWSKYAADTCLQGHEAKKVIGDVFVLQYLKNYGAAFGILQNKQIFLVILTAVILAAIIYILIKTPDTVHYLPVRFLELCWRQGQLAICMTGLFTDM